MLRQVLIKLDGKDPAPVTNLLNVAPSVTTPYYMWEAFVSTDVWDSFLKSLASLRLKGLGVLEVSDVELPKFRRYIGADCAVKDLDATLRAFPGISYMRDFGTPLTMSSPNALRPSRARGKFLIHHSMKGNDVKELTSRLNVQTDPFMFTYYHEPMGNIGSALYRKNASELVKVIKAHPNGSLCVYNGPILTRFWMEQKGNDPEVWWYEGADAFFADCYKGSYKPVGDAIYPSPDWMFGVVERTAQKLNVPWGVPELGGEIHSSDSGGVRHAEWLRSLGSYLKNSPSFLCAGWWNIGGSKLTEGSPSALAWRSQIEMLNG